MSPPKAWKLVRPDPEVRCLLFNVTLLMALSTEYGSSKLAVSGESTSKRSSKTASPGGHALSPSQDTPGVLHQLGWPCVVGARPAPKRPQARTRLQGATPVLSSTVAGADTLPGFDGAEASSL
eukprot:scaffold40574_cov27-Tisochrysis_lutea.AAC.10